MTYQDAIDFLYPLHRFGMKFGLDNMTELCRHLGNPEKKLGLVIHIAGTNGKGSTASFIASICKEAGLKTALYTSPHIEKFTERIRINGEMIPDDAIAEYTSRLQEKIVSLNATFFEATTAIAFKHFADSQVDVSVVEVGLGGRLDATNVVQPTHVVITRIGFDHTEWLGETLSKIAAEKAGIIKQHAKVFTSPQHLDAMETIAQTALQNKAPLVIAPAVTQLSVAPSDLGELRLHLHTRRRSYYGLSTPLWGMYQTENLPLAVLCAEELGLNERAIRAGVTNVLKNTGHRGRLEIISRTPLVLLDVSHNPEGIKAMVKTLMTRRASFKRLLVVFGAMTDKDVSSMLAELSILCSAVFLAAPQLKRAMSAQAMYALAQALNMESSAFTSVAEALAAARAAMQDGDALLVTGSFYTASEAAAALLPVAETASPLM